MDQHCESCCAVSHSLLVTRSETQETEQRSMNASAYFQSLLDTSGQENQVDQVNVQPTEHNRYKNMLQSVELECVQCTQYTPYI